jgi:hypothetical protein
MRRSRYIAGYGWLRAKPAGFAVAATLVVLLVLVTAAGGTQPYETYEEAVAADGPVAQFRLGDATGSSTISDSAGSYTASNSGIVLGGEGPFGGSGSGSFGGEAFATLPSDPLAGATAFTAEGWVDWAGAPLYRQPIFDFGSSSTNYMYLTPASSLTKHTMLFEIRTSAGIVFQVTAPTLKSKAWEYIAVTETSSGTLTLYLNGEQIGQTTGATITPASLGSTPDDYLGKPQVSGESMFDGSMSNVAFYSKALSPERIKAHYDAGEYPVNMALPTISGTAKDGSTLTASKGTWTGLTPITYGYQWMLCNAGGERCSSIPSSTETKYILGHEDVGSTLRVAVTGTNGEGSSTANSAQTAVIAPLAPSNTALPVISGEAEQGQLLAVTTGTWKGTPPFSYTYAWETCNSAGEKCKKITGATASSYRALGSQIGATLRVIVTAKNAAGSKSATSGATPVITTGPPVSTELPVISGKAEDSHTLSASTGSWAGTEPFSYAYQWELCNSAGESCANISGATNSTYVLSPSDVSDTLRVVVTAKNSVGSTSATTQPSAAVAAIPPSNTAPPTISGIARDGQTLTASTGSWNGSPPISYAYQWESCNSSGGSCASISGATSSSYTITHEEVGHTIRVKVTASNSAGEASATSAATGTVAAAAPANTTLPVISGEAKDGRTLSASTGAWNGTPPLTYAYQWQSCNRSGESCSDVSGATHSTYVLGHGDVGTTLRAIVTAMNSVGSASSATEATAVVTAPGPTNITVPAISGTAQEGQTLTASEGTWEGTPPLTYSYQWQSCNSLGEGCIDVSGATSSTYVLGPGEEGTTLRVLVTATNSAGATSSTSQATEVVSASSASGLAYTAEFGSEGSGDGQFEHLADVAVDAKGDLWVLDQGNSRVEEFNQVGEYLRQFGSQGSGNGQLRSPDGLAVDSEGDVWVLDTGNERVEEFTENGEFVRTVGAGMIGSAEGIAVDHHGDVWVSATYQGRLLVFNKNGEYLKAVGSHGSEAGQLGEPEGIAVDSNGDVWVTDWANNRVEELNEAGAYVRQFGTAGSGSGEISHPYGIAANNGHVFVGEIGNHRLQEFNEEGGFLSQLGTPGSEPGQLNLSYPIGLTVNTDEDLWITDSGNNRVEEWKGSSGNPCTDDWVGPEEGSWETAADWSTGATPRATDVACLRRGVTVRVSSPGDQAASILGEGSLVIVGGSLSVAGPALSGGASIHALTLDGGRLDITGSLSASGSLTVSGSPTIEGSGKLVVRPGATGSIGDGECSTHPLLNEVTVVNEGTLTFGSPGGAPDGAIAMEDGARLENAGTFAEDSYDPSCGHETTGYSFYDTSGSAPSIVNTGTFQTDVGARQTKIGVNVSNRNTFEVQSGTLELTGGGSSTNGTWLASAGTTLAFPEGAYALMGGSWAGEGTFALNGATVTAEGLSGAGHENLDMSAGSLTLGDGPTMAVNDLNMTAGRLSTNAEVLASGALSVTGEPLISGSGSVVEGPGATGTIGTGMCSTHPVLSEVAFVNEGTLNFGGDGGTNDGAIAMENGAGFVNRGMFNDESFDAGCGDASNGYSFYDAGGAVPRIVNTGAFEANGGAEPIRLGVETYQQAGSLTIPEDDVLEALAPMSISGGTVEVGGRLNVQSFLETSGEATIKGPGPFVVDRGATGTIGGTRCSILTLDGASVTNEGTLTAPEGMVSMDNDAQLDNPGTYIDNSIGYQRCVIADSIGAGSLRAAGLSSSSLGAGGLNTNSIGPDGASADSVLGGGLEGYSFYDAGGAAPRVVSTGSLLVNTYPRQGRIIIGVNLELDGGLLTVERGELETTEALTANNSPSINLLGEVETRGERQLPAELDIQGTFTASGDPTIGGKGAVLLAAGATGTIGSGECSTHPVLSEVTFINEGTLTLGAAGGAADGAIAMRDGAELHNTGTVHDDSYETGCSFAPAGYSLYDAGGATPSVLNEGAFVTDVAGTATNVGVPFGNDGSVEAQAGRLELSDGGLGEQVATGSWSAPEGQIALTGGEFLFAREVDLSAVQEAGAVVEQQIWSHAPPAIEGEALEGKTLTANPGWTGTYAPSLRSPGDLTGQPVSITYQWEECDGEDEGEEGEEQEVLGADCEPLEGATSPTYTLEEEEVGYTMRVVVTAHNALGTETYSSEATPVIEELGGEIPEGEEGEGEGIEPEFLARGFAPAITLPTESLERHPEPLYKYTRELYKYFAREGYINSNKNTPGKFLYGKQIAAIMGALYVETAYTLSPSKRQHGDCEYEKSELESNCGRGIAQWIEDEERWARVKQYSETHYHQKYNLYGQERVLWQELNGPYLSVRHELEMEGHEKDSVCHTHPTETVCVARAAETFSKHFEVANRDTEENELIEKFAYEILREAKRYGLEW